ncbi:MAG: DUF4349 domain-containing protein [Bacteroidetes bacterium]|nr:DUF4349 domain-containing protein [Bacteroidota bacterium]
MKRLFTKRFRIIVLIFLAVFVLLFLFRLGYGYTLTPGDTQSSEPTFDYFESDKRNYASDDIKSEKYESSSGNEMESFEPIAATDQKYEKIAEVKAESHDFETDENYVRDCVESYDGIIQYERKYGNDGERRLQLQVGVPPQSFDSLYLQLIAVGKIHSKEIIKNDKTNEYLELNARKASLEKTLKSLIEFKAVGGRIDEYINLENRILEIEEQLQNLGVNLGDFDESNEFCTIRFSLSESKAPEKVVWSFYFRCKVALDWTIRNFMYIVIASFFVTLGVYLIMLVTEKWPEFWKRIKGDQSK